MTLSLVTEQDVKQLHPAVRKMLKAQCDGEWDRVTVNDEDGCFTVHNNPGRALRAVQTVTPAPTPPPAVPAPPAPVQAVAAPSVVTPLPRRTAPVPMNVEKKPSRRITQRRKRRERAEAEAAHASRPTTPRPLPSRREPTPDVAALKDAFAKRCGTGDAGGGVRIVSAHREPVPDAHTWSFDPATIDWDGVDYAQPVVILRDCLRHGLPPRVPFQYHAEVLAMYGVAFEAVDAAIRHPHRVEIRPESRAKKYPILAFHRGDVTAIVGFRTPQHPMCIAVYVYSMLQHDTHHAVSAGGGGARKQTGLPNNVRSMISRLRAEGADVRIADPAAKVASVIFQGQDLGKITIGNAPRDTVQSDWQRTVRRMQAVKNRLTTHGAVV